MDTNGTWVKIYVQIERPDSVESSGSKMGKIYLIFISDTNFVINVFLPIFTTFCFL